MESKELVHISGINSGIENDRPHPDSFAEFLAKHELLSNGGSKSAKELVVVDYSLAAKKQLNELELGPSHCHLLRLEPDVVLPSNYSPRRYKQFRTIVTVGGDPSKYPVTVPWPQDMSFHFFSGPRKRDARLEKVVVVNGNKLSLIRGELYSLRRSAIAQVKNLDLFGTSWDYTFLDRLKILLKATGLAVISGRTPVFSGLRGWFRSYPQWRGAIGSGYSPSSNKEKLATMANYKYALVIENSLDYMSEKLFDALLAGCLPIYVGPEVENYGISSNLVVQAKPNLGSILECLENAKSLDFDLFQSHAQEYLNDPQTKLKWSRENVHKRILELVLERPQPMNPTP